MNPDCGTLLTDLYQLTMLQGYWQHGMRETAVFEFFVRKLPEHRNFLVAAGLEQANRSEWICFQSTMTFAVGCERYPERTFKYAKELFLLVNDERGATLSDKPHRRKRRGSQHLGLRVQPLRSS
jgi:hypothetical protein